ncbi:hypothetical protein DKM19_02050 [Streptosporangium sp. 'caverna']|nr:hypothetical protein DKM19_02050 [Streptosporangium sp. 'caverna']
MRLIVLGMTLVLVALVIGTEPALAPRPPIRADLSGGGHSGAESPSAVGAIYSPGRMRPDS